MRENEQRQKASRSFHSQRARYWFIKQGSACPIRSESNWKLFQRATRLERRGYLARFSNLFRKWHWANNFRTKVTFHCVALKVLHVLTMFELTINRIRLLTFEVLIFIKKHLKVDKECNSFIWSLRNKPIVRQKNVLLQKMSHGSLPIPKCKHFLLKVKCWGYGNSK